MAFLRTASEPDPAERRAAHLRSEAGRNSHLLLPLPRHEILVGLVGAGRTLLLIWAISSVQMGSRTDVAKNDRK
jgi:hypothetical protein